MLHGLMGGKKLDFYAKSEIELYMRAMVHLFGGRHPIIQYTS